MKFTFKKIGSVLASAVMLSSTVALAAAANYPSPFVQNGVANVAVVYGGTNTQTDLAAAMQITDNLQKKVTMESVSTTSTNVTGGDFVMIEKAKDKFSLGDSADDFYSSLDDEELSKVLASGTYTNDENDDFDYTQKIELSSDLVLEYFQDTEFNDDKPIIGFNLNSGDHILNYTLDFSDSVTGGTNFINLETTDLPMLGRSYYIVDATGVSGTGVKLTLLDSANSATVTEGESSTIQAGSASYDVSISFVDTNDVILVVNGVTTNKLQEGDVSKVATDTYVAVKNILYNEKETGISKVEISIGSGKIVLENGEEIKINNEDVSDIDEYNDAVIKAYITNSSTDIDKIVLEWNLGDDTWVTPGNDLVLPAFKTIKISMGGFTVPAQEATSLSMDGEDSIKLNTVVEDGALSLNILYKNDTDGFSGIGKSASKNLITSNNSVVTINKSIDKMFVASWLSGDEAESYAFEVTKIDDTEASKNTTTIKNLADGGTKDFDIAESEDFGGVRLTLNAASEQTGVATFTISNAGASGSVSFNKIYTKDGMKIQLPVMNNTLINVTGMSDGLLQNNSATFVMNFTEEDEDGNINDGASFTVTLGFNSDDEVQVSSTSVVDYETEDGSDTYVGYVISPLATKTTFKTGGDQDTIDIEYHGSESYEEVIVAETGVSVSGGAVSTTIVPVTAAEAATLSGKNLIVVGGSCINSIAADLLGGAKCEADFTSATGVGSGQFLIQTFSRTGGAIATLVAGYNAVDTTNAAKYLTTQTVDTTVGKKYRGTSATAATLVVS